MRAAAGYASRDYAESLAEFGDVVDLPNCGGFLLGQKISTGSAHDAVGPYPLLACRDWSALGADLTSLSDRFVCAYAVTDPFGATNVDALSAAFPDVCYAYKQHLTIEYFDCQLLEIDTIENWNNFLQMYHKLDYNSNFIDMY